MTVATTELELRVLVLMPTLRDAERTAMLLRQDGVLSRTCANLGELCRELQHGAGAALLTDDALLLDSNRQLLGALRDQPAWSTLPILVLAREGTSLHGLKATAGDLQGVMIAERPVRTRTLASTVTSALSARRNQYRIRDALLESERQSAELAAQDEKLRQAARLKDEFLATLAHELRNPLAPISTGLSLLGMQDGDEATRERTVTMMQRQVDHMVRLIDDLLDVSRITRGKLELKRERIHLRDVVETAIESSAPLIGRRRHALRKDLVDEDLLLDADPTRIAQVINNLLNNAAKYTPQGGTITLAVRREAGEAVIVVEDTGLGIPSDRLEDVFEMFSQVSCAEVPSDGGLGIGLALVRRLVEMHGGSVVATSAGAGLGSRFTVRLPLAAPVTRPQPAPGAPDVQPALGGKHVVVVDDNVDAAALLSLMLERLGCTTTVAHDGFSALTTLHSAVPHVVILDIGLPGMNGYEVAETLRREDAFAETVLIALTGWGAAADKRRALDAGFDLHLTKPVRAEDLQHALRGAFQNRALRV